MPVCSRAVVRRGSCVNRSIAVRSKTASKGKFVVIKIEDRVVVVCKKKIHNITVRLRHECLGIRNDTSRSTKTTRVQRQ